MKKLSVLKAFVLAAVAFDIAAICIYFKYTYFASERFTPFTIQKKETFYQTASDGEEFKLRYMMASDFPDGSEKLEICEKDDRITSGATLFDRQYEGDDLEIGIDYLYNKNDVKYYNVDIRTYGLLYVSDSVRKRELRSSDTARLAVDSSGKGEKYSVTRRVIG